MNKQQFTPTIHDITPDEDYFKGEWNEEQIKSYANALANLMNDKIDLRWNVDKLKRYLFSNSGDTHIEVLVDNNFYLIVRSTDSHIVVDTIIPKAFAEGVTMIEIA